MGLRITFFDLKSPFRKTLRIGDLPSVVLNRHDNYYRQNEFFIGTIHEGLKFLDIYQEEILSNKKVWQDMLPNRVQQEYRLKNRAKRRSNKSIATDRNVKFVLS